jgi:hypothetical protein
MRQRSLANRVDAAHFLPTIVPNLPKLHRQSPLGMKELLFPMLTQAQ